MTNRPKIAHGLTAVAAQPPCVEAVFYTAPDNPSMAIRASDDRGTLFGLDYASTRPGLIEIIHSKPYVIRGNHIHKGCTETFSVLSGEILIYLLCNCRKKHLLQKLLAPGMSVSILPGIAHAIYTLATNESVAVFGDGDPRDDREKVELITAPTAA